MFGRRKQPEPDKPSALAAGSTAGGGGGSSNGSVTGFDPTSLERAAKAARELDGSKNAKAAVELVKTQEATKQHEAAAKRAEYDAMTKQMELQRVEKEGDEARKTLERKSQYDQQRDVNKDKLDRKRLVDQLNAQKEMQEAGLKRQEEGIERQEKLRRQTLEYEAELRQKTELAKAKAEADGRIREERVNHDLKTEKLRIEMKEKAEGLKKSFDTMVGGVGKGVENFMQDKSKIRNMALLGTLTALGYFGAKTSFGLVGKYVEATMGKPSLVRDTSRISVSSLVKDPAKSFKKLFGGDATKTLEGIVLEPALSSQLDKIAVATSNTKKNRAPFRHLLLHGPPGTGKTMFARNLALNSGLEYAILTGGDVAPLGRDGVTEIHKMFDWATTSRKGLLLFVDEADAFLRNRETETISEDVRNSLNAFLYRTGTETDKFMMVYATNKPEQFDGAITDRVDEMVEFTLPGVEERRSMIKMYIEKYLSNPPGQWSKKVTMVDIDDAAIESAVTKTEGWSGREISKLAIAWQSSAYGTEGATIDAKAFQDTVDRQAKSNATKLKWLDQALAEKMARDK